MKPSTLKMLLATFAVAAIACTQVSRQKNKTEQKVTVVVNDTVTKARKPQPAYLNDPKIGWKQLDEGLFLADINAPVKSKYSDSKITVLKVDPAVYSLNLICAGAEKDNTAKTADQWSKEKNLLAVVNAGMFDGVNAEGEYDARTNRGLMINYNYVNNGKLSTSKYQKAVLAFNPKDKSVPPVQIIDLTCQDWTTLKNKYHSFSQGLRLVDCREKNCWKVETKMWSMVIVAIDRRGDVLFIATRSPYTMYNFVNMLLSLPLNIHNAMYLEGGPETSLYVSAGGTEVQRFGSYETNFNEDDRNDHFWDIPNIIGIRKIRN